MKMYQHLSDTNIVLYDLVGFGGFIALVIFNFANIRKKREFLSYASQYPRYIIENSCFKNKFTSSYIPWAISEILLISAVQFLPTSITNPNLGKILGTGANYFGLLFFIPIMLVIFCLIIGINPLKQIDLITPAFPLALIFTKLGCFCAGCCNGFEWQYGFYNYETQRLEFPSQLLEAGIALLLFIFMMLWRKKAKTGTMFPTYLVIYCVTRFFSEFTRAEENVFAILKTYHILCITGFVVGIIELIFVLKYNDKLIRLFSKSGEEINMQIIDRLSKKTKKRSQAK